MNNLKGDIRPILDALTKAIDSQNETAVRTNATMLIRQMQAMTSAFCARSGPGRTKTVLDDACRDGARMLAIIGHYTEAADALSAVQIGLCAVDASEFALDEFLCRMAIGDKTGARLLNYEQRCWANGRLGKVSRKHTIALDDWQKMMLGQIKHE